MNKRVRIIIGLAGSLVLCIWGIYGILAEYPITGSLLIPILFAAGGFIGTIGGAMELKRMKSG
ncbi:hypothetical protein [Neobacillus mesonae]|uniref:hypothetical protein n=1 Tax=Neobacillus mesonae TaxID=1193713 RepID=UPI00203D79BE|nr:hypothetical protein [Neobacillus mesonae]MCM3571406.1 hypothetical protein [Neobacillus mesonae]